MGKHGPKPRVEITREAVEQHIPCCRSVSQIAERMGMRPDGSQHKRIQQIVESSDLDTGHMKGHGWSKGLTRHTDPSVMSYTESLRENWNDVFCVRTKRYNNGMALRRLVEAGIKSRECEQCGIAEWQGRPAPLDLHHINGDRLDNRIANLQVLCPNCHRFTDNFSSKNKRNNLGVCRN